MTTANAPSTPIYSEFGDDPDFAELVELFVGEIPDRIETLEQSFSQGDRETLRRAAHQLKGAAGGYGFHDVTAPAAALEQSVAGDDPLDAIKDQVDALVVMCRRLTVGAPA